MLKQSCAHKPQRVAKVKLAPWTLDEDSWSGGDQEPITVDQPWRGEGDNIDSGQEGPLKHAGVYELKK